jgi:metal-responsive CopG/Arc/MetJ family transcriptional regulator
MTTRITILPPESLLDEVDSLAAAEHRNRSEIVIEAVLQYVGQPSTNQPRLIHLSTVQAVVRVQNEIARVVAGTDGDCTRIIRC